MIFHLYQPIRLYTLPISNEASYFQKNDEVSMNQLEENLTNSLQVNAQLENIDSKSFGSSDPKEIRNSESENQMPSCPYTYYVAKISSEPLYITIVFNDLEILKNDSKVENFLSNILCYFQK